MNLMLSHLNPLEIQSIQSFFLSIIIFRFLLYGYKIFLYGKFVIDLSDVRNLLELNGAKIVKNFSECTICIADEVSEIIANSCISDENFETPNLKKTKKPLKKKQTNVKPKNCVTLKWFLDSLTKFSLLTLKKYESPLVSYTDSETTDLTSQFGSPKTNTYQEPIWEESEDEQSQESEQSD
jgi:hypothetical protein